MEVSMGVVSFNSREQILKLIRSLHIFESKSDLFINLYLVENGEEKNAGISDLDSLSRQNLRIKIIPNSDNLGFGGGHNKIASYVETYTYYIVNPDIEFVQDDIFFEIESLFSAQSNLNLVSPGIQSPLGELQYYNKFDPTVFDMLIRFTPGMLFARRKDYFIKRKTGYTELQSIEFASGAFMAVKTAEFKAVGGFDERFFLYFEDADLSRELRKNGDALYNPFLRVQHDWQRASRSSLKYLSILVISMIKYFNKWGWKWL